MFTTFAKKNQWLIGYQISLIVIARQPKYHRFYALIMTDTRAPFVFKYVQGSSWTVNWPLSFPRYSAPSWFVWQAGCREGPRPRSSLSRPSSHTTMLITRTYLFATPIYDFQSSHSLLICGTSSKWELFKVFSYSSILSYQRTETKENIAFYVFIAILRSSVIFGQISVAAQ